MTLWLRVFCGYPSYEESGAKWRHDDYRGRNLVKALKWEPFNGYSEFRLRNGKVLKVTAEDTRPAFDLFGSWAAKMIGQSGIESAYLVPVPSSTTVRLDTNPKGLRLCEAIARYSTGLVPLDALWWQHAMVPAHKGGPREVAKLLPFLVLRPDMPADRPVILVDDVATTRGHLKACAARLKANGFGAPVLAIAAAQTVNEHPPHGMFDFPPVDLDAF